MTDGEWHQTSPGVPWQIVAKPYKFTLGFKCPTGCPDADVFFDDVELDQAPTAVTVTSFKATATARDIDVSWRTRSNLEILGFNLFRIQGGNQLKLNRRLIRIRSGRSISESTYRWLDRTAVSKPNYRLQAVLLNGNRRWVAIARAEAVGAVMAPIVLASK